jgi:hypothetical protein
VQGAISVFISDFLHPKGSCSGSPSNEVCERPFRGALIATWYYFVAGAAPALAAAAAFALAAAAAACAGPRDANTVSKLKEAAF